MIYISRHLHLHVGRELHYILWVGCHELLDGLVWDLLSKVDSLDEFLLVYQQHFIFAVVFCYFSRHMSASSQPPVAHLADLRFSSCLSWQSWASTTKWRRSWLCRRRSMTHTEGSATFRGLTTPTSWSLTMGLLWFSGVICNWWEWVAPYFLCSVFRWDMGES